MYFCEELKFIFLFGSVIVMDIGIIHRSDLLDGLYVDIELDNSVQNHYRVLCIGRNGIIHSTSIDGVDYV